MTPRRSLSSLCSRVRSTSQRANTRTKRSKHADGRDRNLVLAVVGPVINAILWLIGCTLPPAERRYTQEGCHR